MKTHSTNYFNTLIEAATDTKVVKGTIPPSKRHKTVAERQYELIAAAPYQYTSDDIIFQVYAERRDLTPDEYPEARTVFFSKGQACLRASPLTKTYGYGIHSNSEGKVALYGMETAIYRKFVADENTTKVKAMKSAR
ncbi:DUF6157 family protein [Sphingobacterium paramultivorum]|uniref:DUF6157 family protein n=1 Tax=Sphingobacterium paramultivorum TaxID=2886510 RepID=UPI00129CA838|nr:DUF6157 family protein [Sphingobacterium paramultivorum]